jgi:hypothetical protein
MADVNDTRATGPVTPEELESVALRVAQASSNLNVLANSSEDVDASEMHNALALIVDYLQDCASDLSKLHLRQEEARP